MKPLVFRSSVQLGPVFGAMTGAALLFLVYVVPLIASDLRDGFSSDAKAIMLIIWGGLTAFATFMGMRVVLRVDDSGVQGQGRHMAWTDIASIDRQDREIGYTGYNSATGVTSRKTQHDLVVFRHKDPTAPGIEVNAALMPQGADALADQVRAILADKTGSGPG